MVPPDQSLEINFGISFSFSVVSERLDEESRGRLRVPGLGEGGGAGARAVILARRTGWVVSGEILRGAKPSPKRLISFFLCHNWTMLLGGWNIVFGAPLRGTVWDWYQSFQRWVCPLLSARGFIKSFLISRTPSNGNRQGWQREARCNF